MRRLAPVVLGSLVALLALLAPTAPVVSATPDPAPPVEPQTSDGVPGELVVPLPSFLPREARTTEVAEWMVAPGVRARVWDTRTARGPVRSYLLSIAYRAPGISFAYLNDGDVRQVARVGELVKDGRAVAGVNGDFYDIHATGAPLGVGRHPVRGLLNGRASGWNSAFYVTRAGRPRIGTVTVRTVIRQRPDLVIGTVNSPRVDPQGIGLYTPRWGATAGNTVIGGPQKRRRMVLVQQGRVVQTSTRLPYRQRFEGHLLIGRGDGADRLAELEVGDRLTLRTETVGDPLLAITGSEQILDDSRVLARDDRVLHPRTAVGIDADHRRVLLLVVDGRQDVSRGYTLVELARTMRSLGAEDALNLDGGGSSTMVGLGPNGGLRLVNSPSDGRQRRVANALGVRYRAPR